MVAIKNPARVAAGELGARRRWGEPRVVRLDELTPDQRRLVVTMIEAAKKAAGEAAPATGAAEVTTHDRAAAG